MSGVLLAEVGGVHVRENVWSIVWEHFEIHPDDDQRRVGVLTLLLFICAVVCPSIQRQDLQLPGVLVRLPLHRDWQWHHRCRWRAVQPRGEAAPFVTPPACTRCIFAA